jgi:flagellar motor switch protein FliM
VQELFLNSLEKAWPLADPLQLTAGAPGSPRKVWTVGIGDLVLFVRLNVTTPFGEHPVYLLIPRMGVWARLGAAPTQPKPLSTAPSEHIQALVREMTVELTVLLGSAELSMQDLAELHTGDVVILRQKVDQPLEGLLAGKRKFRVWPGVIGDHAAVVIDASTEGK